MRTAWLPSLLQMQLLPEANQSFLIVLVALLLLPKFNSSHVVTNSPEPVPNSITTVIAGSDAVDSIIAFGFSQL